MRIPDRDGVPRGDQWIRQRAAEPARLVPVHAGDWDGPEDLKAILEAKQRNPGRPLAHYRDQSGRLVLQAAEVIAKR